MGKRGIKTGKRRKNNRTRKRFQRVRKLWGGSKSFAEGSKSFAEAPNSKPVSDLGSPSPRQINDQGDPVSPATSTASSYDASTASQISRTSSALLETADALPSNLKKISYASTWIGTATVKLYNRRQKMNLGTLKQYDLQFSDNYNTHLIAQKTTHPNHHAALLSYIEYDTLKYTKDTEEYKQHINYLNNERYYADNLQEKEDYLDRVVCNNPQRKVMRHGSNESVSYGVDYGITDDEIYQHLGVMMNGPWRDDRLVQKSQGAPAPAPAPLFADV